jgi:dynein heavy chain, axonemal
MMVPDYAMISEIILYSYGYANARPLAVKIVTTYKLCSEQLSSQSHYDYGMRAVIAVLRAAGNLKRTESYVPEEVLVLRSIIDVNLPKFLSPDVPLFHGIVSDLFPGVKVDPPDRKAMKAAFYDICLKRGLIGEEYFWEKVVQVYDMMVVRHGFMIVGAPFAGKTSTWKVLAGILGQLACQYPDDGRWSKVISFIQNPKSITMGQLYGEFDAVTHEWSDGILPINFRNAASNKVGNPEDRKWIVFDGPVDALWIENLNTVLDDNKKLCLMSGEIIGMTDVMSMIFEPMDLLAASPATVSRCGMIYMEPEKLGWKPLVTAWMELHKPRGRFSGTSPFISPSAQHEEEHELHKLSLSEADAELISLLVDWLIEPCLCFVRKEVVEMSPTVDSNLVMSFLNIFEIILEQALRKYHNPNDSTYFDFEENEEGLTKPRQQDIECCFIFAAVWSIGITGNSESQHKFSSFLANILVTMDNLEKAYPSVWTALLLRNWTKPELAALHKGTVILPMTMKHTIYECVYNTMKSTWETWEDQLPDYTIPSMNVSFSDIVVPSIYTAQMEYMLQLLVPKQRNILVCGPTGTGKTTYINHTLNDILSKSEYKTLSLGFSAKTSANMTQGIIDGKLDKRRKGIYGPPLGQKCIIFVDDLNLPEVEQYGAQPPIELLRQLVDCKGWYDLKEKKWISIVDTSLVAAMGLAGGGRNQVTPRLLRHFNLISISEFDDQTLRHIFTTIVDWHFHRYQFTEELCDYASSSIVEATLDTYRAAMKNLLPTPSKSHYTFNLRDFSRVIQGVLFSRPSTTSSKQSLIRLWTHEALRVLGDRLTDDPDRSWFHAHLQGTCENRFNMSFYEIFQSLDAENQKFVDFNHMRNLIFGDYLDSQDEHQHEEEKCYAEITDPTALHHRVEEYLEEYNQLSKKPMDLVMFSFAIEHISRIIRLLKMPGGNALLVGVGGSGRQSLTKLATFISQYVLMQIEVSKNYGKNEWREDMKNVLKNAGCGTTPVVFLFSDTQIKDESFVEDINNILNNGEIPNLFALDDRTAISEAVRPLARQIFGKAAADMSVQDLYTYFVQRVRQQLHIVLAFSPVGDAFRDRLRKFPALVNGCTIDWMTNWPSDALIAVAKKFLSDIPFDSEDIRMSIVSLCQRFHQDIRQLSESYHKHLHRYNYVTPTSYLELIMAYKENLSKKRNEVSEARKRYEVGIEKLSFAADQVNMMHRELEGLQPQLIESAAATEQLMKAIEQKMPGVLQTRQVVSAEAATAQAEADLVQKQKNEVEADLAEAIPALEEAIAALNTIKTPDINEIKALPNPPPKIRTVCKALCIMLDVKPARIPDPENPSKRIMDYWGPSQKMLSDSQFITRLLEYNKDNIAPRVIQEIVRDFIDNPAADFTPEKVASASKAAEGMCRWVYAMVTYDRVAKIVGPKKAALAEAEAKLQATMAALNAKKEALERVENDLLGLQQQFENTKNKKAELELQAKLCDSKIDRATQLLGGLGGEKDRWTESAGKLSEQYTQLTGDVLIASGVLAYLGPFTATYRQRQVEEWIKILKQSKIPCSDNPTLSAILGDPVRIRQWHIDALPTDGFSIENGIIVFNARRWPLMIDPQSQANKWIRNLEKANGLQVIKLSDQNYLRTLENAIQFGMPVLLENVGEELDPILEPLLRKQIFKQGGIKCIRLGDSTIEYNENFRFYMTTKLRNPHYLPEVSVTVTLLNFMITPEGLQDQLLGIVVSQERPDLEEQRNALIVQSAENNRMLKGIEEKILSIMSSSSSDNILEDETAILTLKESKQLGDEIQRKQAVAEETEQSINRVRESYQPIAYSAQILFFCIADLANLEPVYQYSLSWFLNLFLASIMQSEKGRDVKQRLMHLTEHFTYSLYRNICRSLLERHKLIFSFLLTSRIAIGKKQIDMDEWNYLLYGSAASRTDASAHPNPAAAWLQNKQWEAICQLGQQVPRFSDFPVDFVLHIDEWKQVYDSRSCEDEDYPGILNALPKSSISRLCVLKCIRPDKLVAGIRKFVEIVMTEKYITYPGFDVLSCYEDSSPVVPLVFILSPGSDPMTAILRAAETLHTTIDSISLGQGQGPKAERLIARAKEKGTWVVLQNCHLAPSWMPTLDKICEQFDGDEIHPSFRLWCTTYPSEVFPVTVLQNSVKMTNEPPKGIRANLQGSYRMDPISNPAFFDSSASSAFRRLLFGLCFFHAIVQERRLFGPLGWNIPYEFNESDLRISVQQLVLFLQEDSNGSSIPFKALQYTAGECNYGGRVTDDKDRRLLNCILKRFFSTNFLSTPSSDNVDVFLGGPEDPNASYESYLEYLNNLPMDAPPAIFGLHENATLTKDQNDSQILIMALIDTESSRGVAASDESSSSSHMSSDDQLLMIANDLLSQLPNNFDMEFAQLKYPVRWDESMNTVLCQELVRFNHLLSLMRESLTNIQKAVKGFVVMSSELEVFGNALLMNRVPQLWKSRSYPSLKSLSGYIQDLQRRLQFFADWLLGKPPAVFWISGFFFTQAFLTGAAQNYARRYIIPIDDVVFDFHMLPKDATAYPTPPDNGVYTDGFFLEGARWDGEQGCLEESMPKVLFSPAPLIHWMPYRKADVPVYPHYKCPVYKTSDRR